MFGKSLHDLVKRNNYKVKLYTMPEENKSQDAKDFTKKIVNEGSF
ncbi:hypothetical protein RHG00_14445 [Clostridioides difficile]|nr:hypothetical protein [Clostridioides difficile]